MLYEGPMNLGLSATRPSVRQFLSKHFSQDWLFSFFIFCMKLSDRKSSDLTGPNFLEKFLLARTMFQTIRYKPKSYINLAVLLIRLFHSLYSITQLDELNIVHSSI